MIESSENLPPPRQMKVEHWPDIDRRLWLAGIMPRRLLDLSGPTKVWRPATIITVAKSYGRWLRWLEESGWLDPAESPVTRCTPDRVAGYLTALDTAFASTTVAAYVLGLAMALTRMSPAADLQWLYEAVNVHKKRATPVRDKRARIVPIQELFTLGEKLMAQSSSESRSAFMQAVHFRDGLMIAFLAALPIRIANLQMMQVGRHLVRVGANYDLFFTKVETKTHRELSMPLKASLTSAVDLYLDLYRPYLLQQAKPATPPAGDAMWVSRYGMQMAIPSLHSRICEITEKHLEKRINPHLFRDCAATSIALDDPDHVAITMSVLGHTNMKTSERSYNHALNRNAVQLHGNAMSALRKRLAQKARKNG